MYSILYQVYSDVYGWKVKFKNDLIWGDFVLPWIFAVVFALKYVCGLVLGYLLSWESFVLWSWSCEQVGWVLDLQTPQNAGVFLYFRVGFSKLPFRTFQKILSLRWWGWRLGEWQVTCEIPDP